MDDVMREQRAEVVVPHLIEVLDHLDDDLDRIELWTAALSCFQQLLPNTSPTTSCLTSGKEPFEACFTRPKIKLWMLPTKSPPKTCTGRLEIVRRRSPMLLEGA
jgi:hypothetical protein